MKLVSGCRLNGIVCYRYLKQAYSEPCRFRIEKGGGRLVITRERDILHIHYKAEKKTDANSSSLVLCSACARNEVRSSWY